MLNLLYIDDDDTNRRVIGDMLAVAEARMTGAATGEQGLALLTEQRFDAVLVNLRMPGMDGGAVVAAIRSGPDATRNVPIVMITADCFMAARDHSLSGVDVTITKPVSMTGLFDAVGVALATQR